MDFQELCGIFITQNPDGTHNVMLWDGADYVTEAVKTAAEAIEACKPFLTVGPILNLCPACEKCWSRKHIHKGTAGALNQDNPQHCLDCEHEQPTKQDTAEFMYVCWIPPVDDEDDGFPF